MKTLKKLLWIIAALGVGVFFIITGATDLKNSKRLAAQGKSTTAEVTDFHERRGRKFSGRKYYLKVSFKSESGKTVEQELQVSEDIYDAGKDSGKVKVFYLPDDPTICTAGNAVETKYGSILWGVGFVCASIFLVATFRQKNVDDVTEEAADSINKSLGPLKQTRHEYAAVDANDFKHLDLSFYDEGWRYLEQLGYTYLGDQENLTAPSSMAARTFLRMMTSQDGTIMAALYHFKPKMVLKVMSIKDAKILDLETWFTNGCFVTTSNAESAGKLASPPAIDAQFLPSETPIETIVQFHNQRVQSYLAGNPGVQAYGIRTLEDVMNAQAEMQRIKAEFRQQAGLSKEELERISGESSPEIDKLHASLEERKAREQQQKQK
jgi:hypothetical protein